ncbi:MAG: hypothetical protein BMS9Abin05_2547 [Rhodothermia bacterium]|nr:MAG: hypothetical protein BMS9Abin05_2547 [Rhodothermia bacterium]
MLSPGIFRSLAISVAIGCCISLSSAQSLRLIDISLSAGIQTDARGTGISAFDFDRDGWDDITIALKDRAPALFRNNQDGTFTDVAAQYGITGDSSLVIPIWADINNDGLPDLFLGHRLEGKNTLWLNQGGGSFTDVTDAFGVESSISLGSAAFGDVDGDGFIDLFLAVRGGLDVLYQNVDGTHFQDVSELAGIQGGDNVPHNLDSWQSVWTDYDRDGDVDLFAVRDFNSFTRLHVNDGTFPMLDVAADANIAFNGFGFSMGMAWGDINGDGWQDAYITRIQLGRLYLNDGRGVFSDVATERGAGRNGVSWGVIFSDFESDGDDDLFIVSDRSWQRTASILYTNEDGFFTETSQSTGIPFDFFAQGLASGDFNNDGLMDFVVSSINGDHRVLINDTIDAGNWVQVSLKGTLQNSLAIGSRVEIDAGGRTFVRSVSGGDSFCSQSSGVLHFGVGDATMIDELRVYWGVLDRPSSKTV